MVLREPDSADPPGTDFSIEEEFHQQHFYRRWRNSQRVNTTTKISAFLFIISIFIPVDHSQQCVEFVFKLF
jgi:hypothetical protein